MSNLDALTQDYLNDLSSIKDVIPNSEMQSIMDMLVDSLPKNEEYLRKIFSFEFGDLSLMGDVHICFDERTEYNMDLTFCNNLPDGMKSLSLTHHESSDNFAANADNMINFLNERISAVESMLDSMKQARDKIAELMIGDGDNE